MLQHGRHNYNQMETLPPNGGKWENLFPNLPYTGTFGAGAIIQGTGLFLL
jgi:hypothetical protein